MKSLTKSIYLLFLFVFARPKFQKFNERIFRIVIGPLGFMNFSEDFRLTGERRIFRELSRYGIDTALDIGANHGQWAWMFLSETNGSVYSIEPGLESFGLLQNKAKDFSHRSRVFNVAIGATDEEQLLYVHQEVTALSFTDSRMKSVPLLADKSYKVEKVNQITLDSFAQRYLNHLDTVDFVKIDTEGSEMNVLLGGQIFLQKKKPKFIQIEMNWHQLFAGHTLFDFSQVLPEYEVHQILPFGKGLYPVDPKSPIRNFSQLSNFLFIRRDLLD